MTSNISETSPRTVPGPNACRSLIRSRWYRPNGRGVGVGHLGLWRSKRNTTRICLGRQLQLITAFIHWKWCGSATGEHGTTTEAMVSLVRDFWISAGLRLRFPSQSSFSLKTGSPGCIYGTSDPGRCSVGGGALRQRLSSSAGILITWVHRKPL